MEFISLLNRFSTITDYDERINAMCDYLMLHKSDVRSYYACQLSDEELLEEIRDIAYMYAYYVLNAESDTHIIALLYYITYKEEVS